MSGHTVVRYHDFCAGHRVVGHESKCRHLHGHNYRVHFHVRPSQELHIDPYCKDQLVVGGLDKVGRVVDFSVVKERLCNWLEDNWDHKFIAWEHDELIPYIDNLLSDYGKHSDSDHQVFEQSVVYVPFNPTAENMAEYLVETIGPVALKDTGVELAGVVLEETRKCSVSYFKD